MLARSYVLSHSPTIAPSRCFGITMAQRSKYRALDLATKVKVLQEVEESASSKQNIAQKYGIKPSTLSTYLKNKDSIMNAYEQEKFQASRKRMRTGAHADVEAALLLWIKEARSHKLPWPTKLGQKRYPQVVN